MTEENTKAAGRTASNTVKENFFTPKKAPGKEESGVKVEELNGRTILHPISHLNEISLIK